jgi:hypothetical protein
MGKTIECGPLVATPILPREAVSGTVRGNTDFIVTPYHPDQRCTPSSVAGHTLYERADPFRQFLPGGYVDLINTTFEAETERVCRVTGSEWHGESEYLVKLEGAEFVGYKAYCIFGLRDPKAIRQIDPLLEAISAEVEMHFPFSPEAGYHLNFHVYGRDAIMGDREPTPNITSHEICVVSETVAPTRAEAEEMGKLVKYMALRANYPEKISTAGGAALIADEILPSPHPAYRWRIDHLLPLQDPFELFPAEMEIIDEA